MRAKRKRASKAMAKEGPLLAARRGERRIIDDYSNSIQLLEK